MLGWKNFKKLLQRLRGLPVEVNVEANKELLSAIKRQEEELEKLEGGLLRKRSADLIRQAREGTSRDGLLIDAFALVREAARRTIGLRPFDVQIMAGIAMHRGNLAEMQTGEGKTLAAVFPAYINALDGQGVHVLTFNDYLARRDAEWMGPIYSSLGLTVAYVQQGSRRRARQEAYACDITYLTAKEAGFDYLRDQLCLMKENQVQRAFHLAVVDEADSILIDEARVPLVIAGSTPTPQSNPRQMAEIVRDLKATIDFKTDEHSRNVYLTESGLDRVEGVLGCGSLHDTENHALLAQLSLALQAAVLLHRDVDYIVRDGRVELVDEFTGRVVENRRWPDGLQAAVEAKEGLQIQPDGEIRGSITLQHFLRLYPKICAMTATAQSSAEELKEFYGLDVVVIPPNRDCIRIDHPDVVFTHQAAKIKVLVKEIQQVQATGRPILVGTRSVGESEQLNAALQEVGVHCQLLNAKNDELEAKIIARAGALDAVTISTNMAGRGTDIRLGGEREEDHEEVRELGGLYVIGTNRHESIRIDNQLRGRAGRQGDPGSSRFFVSLEDDLIERYGIQKLIPYRYRTEKADGPIDDPLVSREIARAQRIIEGQTFTIRRTLWKYSNLIEKQRRVIQQYRQEVLLDKLPLDLLSKRAPQRYSELRERVGVAVLRGVERQITLFHVDRCWTEHLVQVSDIREGIQWRALGGSGAFDDFQWMNPGGTDPLIEFQKLTARIFQDLRQRIDNAVVEGFLSAEIGENGIDVEKEGLRGPSSTWTYLVSDNPFGDWIERVFKGLKRALTKRGH